MRRLFGTLAGVLLLLGVMATPAGAATYVPTGPTLSLSLNVIKPLTTVTATATGFLGNTLVTLTGHSTPVVVGTAMTDAAGSVTFTFAMPYLHPGAHTMTATAGDLVASADLTILASATLDEDAPTPAAAVPTPTPVSSGGLAFTGANVTGVALAGIALVMLGGLALFRGRRRSSV